MRAPRRNEKPRKTARKSRKIDARDAPGAVRATQNRGKIASEEREQALETRKVGPHAPGNEKCASEARPRTGKVRPERAESEGPETLIR